MPVYLRLPWLGSVCTWFEKQVVRICRQTMLFAVEPRVVYTTNKLLSATNRDALPALQKNNVIYQFSCQCDNRYVGCIFQRLKDRINEHVHKSIRSRSSF